MNDGELLTRLRDEAERRSVGSDPAHDFLHVRRVASLGERIALAEGADVTVVVAAALLHELLNLPKSHPESHRSGDLCAEEAAVVLRGLGVAESRASAICACIRDHGFSKGVLPVALEAKVLQDADRLDAIGAIGIARCFSTCASMGRPFYSVDDPFCRLRAPDDKSFGIDHFYRKLLCIPEGLHTDTARSLGKDRLAAMRAFLSQLESEL